MDAKTGSRYRKKFSLLDEEDIREIELKKTKRQASLKSAVSQTAEPENTTLAKFWFRAAKCKSGTNSQQAGAQTWEAEMDLERHGNRPLRLRFQAPGSATDWTIEMSERDAIAFWEWLGEAVTEFELRREQ